MVVAVEELALDPSYDELQIYSIMLSLVISFSIVSYCQRELLISYMAGWLYTCVRSYFLFTQNSKLGGENSTFSWFRMNTFILLALVVSYLFSRRYQ
jgi:hypothetical protein